MALSSEQVRALLTAAQDARNEALYVVAVPTGLRQGELLGLKWTDVDLACRRLSVRRALKVTYQGLDFGPPKTRRVVGPYRLARRWWPFCTLTGPARTKRG
jgi:integrase